MPTSAQEQKDLDLLHEAQKKVLEKLVQAHIKKYPD